MQIIYRRLLEEKLLYSLGKYPVTAIVGPRQCGKTTLARHVLKNREDYHFLDLELPSDLRRLTDSELFLGERSGKLICIDEIQRMPELFPLMRALVDQKRVPGRFLILGSASQDLIRRGTETLAGRIHYLELTPFLFEEVYYEDHRPDVFKKLWWRGGYPTAYLAEKEVLCREWMNDFIQTFLSRDIPEFGFSIPPTKLFRFWRMVSHYHGQLLNASKIGQSMGWSHNTVFKYIDLLEQTFMIRKLMPLEVNLKKRLVKSAKIYIRDTGVFHALQEVDSYDALYAHPMFGASWEGFCIEQIIQKLPGWHPFFYRTSSGEEIDLILQKEKQRLGFECKASISPTLSKGFNNTKEALNLEKVWVVCPMVDEGYELKKDVHVTGLCALFTELENV